MFCSPTERRLVIWPGIAHYADCRRTLNVQTGTHSADVQLKERIPLFLLAIDAGPISLPHPLSVSGDCESFPLVPHPTVRNNLQHCWALCHLTLHGQNTQPLEGRNRGLCAWKLWSSNHHIWLIRFELIFHHYLFSPFSVKSFSWNCFRMALQDRSEPIVCYD